MTVSDLDRSKNSHRYRDPRTGELLIGVTTVVGSFSEGDKAGAMAGAAVKLTKMGLSYHDEWNAKRNLGTRVHAYIGQWAKGKTADVLAEDEGHLDAFTAFCRAKKPEWLETERAVVSSLGYGGRFDLIGYFEGEYWALDGKTGKIYETELELQLAGYMGTDGMVVYDAAGTAIGIEPLPHVDRWAGLYLTGDGKAQLVEVAKPTETRSRAEVQAAAKQAFWNLLAVRLWADSRKKAE